MKETAEDLAPSGFPRLAGLLGTEVFHRHREELQRFGVGPLWQVERDLALLSRHVSAADMVGAYRDLMRHPGRFVNALYEIHVAAMLAPFVDRIQLAPKVGRRRCDLSCVVGSETVFIEATTWTDSFPPPDGRLHARTTIELSFDPTSTRDSDVRSIPASKQLRDRIGDEARQLPGDAMAVVVVGAPQSCSAYVAAALFGDEYAVVTKERDWRERVPNGIFEVPDDIGGISRLSGVVWLKLCPGDADIQTQSRLFLNPRSARPLSAEIEERFVQVFDRGVVLQRELQRIKQILVDEYRAERIILFGSLAEEMSTGYDRLHQWSDIDLAVIKATSRRFTDRIGDVLRLVEPRVGVNVFVYTPEEFERADRGSSFFVRDEVVKRGTDLFP